MSAANPQASADAQPCVWMSAGLLSYKLCDRDFDCENCPLDGALSGHAVHTPGHVAVLSPSELTRFIPEDRLYAPGHSWLQSLPASDGLLFRFGVDAFAATIMGNCHSVSCYAVDDLPVPGQVLCEIDLGLSVLLLVVPIAGTLVKTNERLDHDPSQLITAPYGDGWIAELRALDLTQVRSLFTPQVAYERTRLDLHRFRRQVAMQLLADTEEIGLCLGDGGELADLRRMLGGPTYMKLICEMIH